MYVCLYVCAYIHCKAFVLCAYSGKYAYVHIYQSMSIKHTACLYVCMCIRMYVCMYMICISSVARSLMSSHALVHVHTYICAHECVATSILVHASSMYVYTHLFFFQYIGLLLIVCWCFSSILVYVISSILLRCPSVLVYCFQYTTVLFQCTHVLFPVYYCVIPVYSVLFPAYYCVVPVYSCIVSSILLCYSSAECIVSSILESNCHMCSMYVHTYVRTM